MKLAKLLVPAVFGCSAAIATPEDAQGMCRTIRGTIAEQAGKEVGGSLRVQYGGSCTPANAPDLLTQPDIDGALVGGASLDPDSFAKIVQSAPKR